MGRCVRYSECLRYKDNIFTYDNNSTRGQPASVEEWKQGKPDYDEL